MKVRLPIIWRETEKLSEEDRTRYNALGQDPVETVENSFAVIELDQVESWYPLNESTAVYLNSGKRYEVDIPDEVFTGLFSKMTLEIIGEIEVKMEDDNDE